MFTRKARVLTVAMGGLLFAAPRVFAQPLTTPTDWGWRLDRPARLVGGGEVSDTSWYFVGMPPGWHITTGPGAVLYHPQERVTGRYSLVADFVLFEKPTESAYGFVLGSADLASSASPHVLVQLRRDGAVRVVSAAGGAQTVLAPWRVRSAIKPNNGTDVVTNRLRVAVGDDSLRVFVNDSAVVSVSATGLGTDGQYGLAIGAGLNFHITTFDVVRHLAPARR